MAAEISDKLIHVRHIFVLVSFLVYGAVNNVVCLTLYGERQICKQHGYPEFLKDRVFRVATKIGQSDLFFDKFVIFLHRPYADIFFMPIFWIFAATMNFIAANIGINYLSPASFFNTSSLSAYLNATSSFNTEPSFSPSFLCACHFISSVALA